MSIIAEKYRGNYKGASDWLSKLLNEHATDKVTREKVTKGAEGEPDTTEVVETGKTRVNIEKLFALAEANGIDARGKYGDQVDRKNAPGRLRMTIGNMLRAAAKRRHGLNVGDEFVEAPEDFINGAEKTENPDGSKIAKVKVDAGEADPENEQSEKEDETEAA